MDRGAWRAYVCIVDRTLRYLGLGILAVAAWLLLAGELDWLDREAANVWFGPLFKVGAGCFVVGLVVRAIAPGVRWVRRGRCVRCGTPTGSGQAYCLDHLQATVNEARDHAHDAWSPTRRRGRRA
jgi:hypothetical protein